MKYKRIGLDTNVLIYYIEEHPFYLRKIEPLIDRIAEGKATGITSYVTLLELLVKPLREKRFDLVEQYKTILQAQLDMVAIDEPVSIKAAQLRAKYGIKTPDAIQLASVITKKGDVFVTNDERLGDVKEIEVLTLREIPD
ncbi:MAG: PIN domain protein [Candidatus Methanoperedens nitroreducens]|uniref:PIN domain protein n=1 Tax=Candidatus Methanoperedens nitratireducens TaxID=1392998 RepID=A0A0P8CHQ6_9EURY|nr:type II toxin-antitoxin system VapC family toxin [Candidatus Methanoperedens sp. BLZ2]KPQ42277.1 MAG: PIN domain protein [Candidatus Methanoperedens sp. BLZ1]MBZ0174350.1 type II toxin-antitoxin system VapC family toxin [Candidatus Methanoperedens nitroreducens]MCX9079883.1 type II toxin-antitoxin system VapC family toxin [Candidatus Methanoperedens sp.]MCX9087747.1 type II toxin-antitoxin system VapC family toxin [Candidatus Methanoperedens sp.]